MKIKIIEVKRIYDNFICKNGATLFKKQCILSEDDKPEKYGQVVTFTDRIKIDAGTEHEVGKKEKKSYTTDTGKEITYTQYTIYAPKNENYQGKSGGNGGGWKSAPHGQYTMQEWDDLFQHAAEVTEKIIPDKISDSYQKVFSTYMIGAKDAGVKIPKDNDRKELAPQHEPTPPDFNGGDPDPREIPF